MRRVIVADALLLVIYLLAANPAVANLVAHEWIGLVAGCFLVVHGIKAFGRSGRGHLYPLRVLIDIFMALSLVTCLVSGLAISGAILPLLGFFAPDGFFFWEPLHSASAKFLLGFLLLHGILQIRWLGVFVRKAAA